MRAFQRAVLFVLAAQVLPASTMLFSSGPATVGGASVNVSAEFDFDPTNHRITLTLLNLQNNPTDINQLLGSVRFTLNNAGTPVPTIASTSIATFDIASNRTPVTHNVANAWTINPVTTGSSQMAFCTICATTAGKEMIVGGPASTLLYANANGTIRGNSARNPYILGSGGTYASGALHNLDSVPSWTFTVPTMTTATTVSAVIFGFGNGSGTNPNYGTNFLEVDAYATPEPGPLVCVFAGLGLIGLGAYKRRSRQS